MLLGLLLVAFAVSMAQTPAQVDQKKPAESCCSMESCCCNDGSCPMKKEGETTCCMSKHDATMKHDKDHKDCCNVKQKDKTKNKKAA
jgi:hypothetical protein